MGGTYIDNVSVVPDTMFHQMEVDPRHFAFGSERLELPYCHGIVLSIVECEVANLNDISDAKSA